MFRRLQRPGFQAGAWCWWRLINPEYDIPRLAASSLPPLLYIYNIIFALSRIALAQTPAGNWTPLSGHQAEVFLSYLGTQPHRTQPHRTQRIALSFASHSAASHVLAHRLAQRPSHSPKPRRGIEPRSQATRPRYSCLPRHSAASHSAASHSAHRTHSRIALSRIARPRAPPRSAAESRLGSARLGSARLGCGAVASAVAAAAAVAVAAAAAAAVRLLLSAAAVVRLRLWLGSAALGCARLGSARLGSWLG